MLDARYEKVREGGVIRSQAVLVAVGIGADGRRAIVGVELAQREKRYFDQRRIGSTEERTRRTVVHDGAALRKIERAGGELIRQWDRFLGNVYHVP